MKIREVKQIVKGYPAIEGAGVKLIRVLGPDNIRDIDPFLMLDAFKSDNPADYIKGFPMHPHRGIETITYLLEGRVDHGDSLGNRDTLRDGDLQWMTAGSGILHEEMPKATKMLNGLQFWLNLPAKDKMTKPSYFPISPDMVKNIDVEGGRIKLIAGEYMGEKGVEPNYVKATMMDVQLAADVTFDIPVPALENSFAYILDGAAYFGEEGAPVQQYSAAIFTKGDTVRIRATSLGVRLVLLAGQPLGEPVAWGGPIVMNTDEELQEAFWELRQGTFIKK
ncbi:MAG: pirin family protein [Defluviitaleaceae bacterium]|nr:pirin family protein [Defluviitaleaceae bacterium]